jgi:hypothetical protein
MAGNALRTVQKFFPGVTAVVDAERNAVIEVMSRDANPRASKNHEECALAVACKRQMNLDGVIIARSVAYLVKGKRARRFMLPPGTAREVVSFDRGAGFEPGRYLLSAVTKNKKLGALTSGSNRRSGAGKPPRFRHLTANVRTVLGGQRPEEN